MGMDRWDRRAGGLRVTCSSCPPRLPQAASAGVILSALPAWLSVWQMRAVGCYPQGLRMRVLSQQSLCPSICGQHHALLCSAPCGSNHAPAVSSSHPKG